MARRIRFVTIFTAAWALAAAPAWAQQRVEASFNVGYSASEGITSDQVPRLGQLYDTLAVDSGASVNFTVGFFVAEQAEVEFLWARQNSRLEADGPAGKLPVSELALYNYMGDFVYHLGRHDSKVRPYVFGGIGATQYSFGTNLLAGSTGSIPGDTRFSTNWGGGVKVSLSPNIGAKIGVRWTPTYINSTSSGIWCDPFYGCWPLADAQYSNQFETSFGVNIRFD
jgi:opacity protein-like surface antigen